MSQIEASRKLVIPLIASVIALAWTGVGTAAADPVPGEKQPLTRAIYIADPSAHVFGGKLYLYPSHDIENGIRADDEGSNYDMRDYHVFSLEDFSSPLVDRGAALKLADIPWADRQLWAPDAASKYGTYYLYFPAKDRTGLFRIGVATSPKPEGPFAARPEPIAGSFSVDPCAFVDEDGTAYLVFGGLRGGQLEHWQSGSYEPGAREPEGGARALGPRIARLRGDMLEIEGGIREIAILNGDGTPVRAEQRDRKFFEASWMHKYGGKYYLSYSTGESQRLAYAVGDSPFGPFTYRGMLLRPVVGWTTHHSIVEFEGGWYLFYHDASLSGGRDNLRCVKYAKLEIDGAGDIKTVWP